jgi:hypothetical protein
VLAEEHHFGTQEYILMAIAVIGGLVGIGIAFSKYIKQNQVPAADAEINGFAKVFTINIMLMKHMTLFSLKQQFIKIL